MAFAQSTQELDFYFETDTIAVDQGKTFTNFLVIKNSSSEEVTIDKLVPEDNYPGALLLPPKTFALKAGQTKRFPIKFIVNTDFMKRESADISFVIDYIQVGKSKTQTTSFSVLKTIEKQLALYSFSRENYINPASKETTISIFIENRSYSRRSIKLSFKSLADELEISPNEQTVSLEAREKKLVEVKVGLRRNSNLFSDYNLQVNAYDLITNEEVGNITLKVIALSNNRQVQRGSIYQQGQNFAELAYNENSTGHNYLQFRGNTEFSSGKEIEGRMNIAGDYFLEENQYNLYDSWVELERKGSLLRLGNIYASDYDFSISGRGGKLVTPIGENQQIELLAVENIYNLYGTYFTQDKGATMIGAKYEYGTLNSFNGKVSYVYDHDPRLEIDSHLAHWKSSFALNYMHNFQVETGISHERGLIYEDQKSGASAGLNYNLHLGDWDFRSTNSFASKNYVGLNRGSYNLIQNIGYKLAPLQQIFIQYQNSQIAPEYLSNQNFIQGSVPNYRPEYFYSSQLAQIGYQFPISRWNILLSPKIEKQKNNANFNSHELLSYRLSSNIGTSFRNQSLNLSMEYSYSKADYNLDWFYSFTSTLSYRYKNLSLNGSLKANPNDVIDLNYYGYNNEDFINYNLYASYNFQTFNKSLSGSIAAGTNFSGLYKNENQNVSGNFEYKIASSWATTAYGNYSNYQSTQTNGYGGDNYQFRIGIKKYFLKATAAGNHKVSLQLFEDTNANGVLDTDEMILANHAVKLDNFIAITDKNGKVYFQNVPKGSYTIKIEESAEARLMMDPVIMVDKNLKLQVGLIKNIKVTGKLIEVKQAYDILETSVRGIIVYARDKKGVVQSTVVNQNDEFEFFLKDGTYDIYIENDKFKYENPIKTINVNRAINPEVLLFEYSKKDTTIKVKKF